MTSPRNDNRDIGMQAEIAALYFQADSSHRWNTKKSFTYRNAGRLFGIGLGLCFGSILGIILLTTGNTTLAEREVAFWLLLCVGWAGLFLALFSFNRMGSDSNWSAGAKTLATLGLIGVFGLIIYSISLQIS